MGEILEREPASRSLAPPFPAKGGELPSPPEGLLACWLAAWAQGRTILHVARSETRARRLAPAVAAVAPAVDVVLFPPWDCLPCDRAPPSRSVMGERMAALRRVAEPAPGGRVVVTTVDALLQRVPPVEAVCAAVLRLRVGDGIEPDGLRRRLLGLGYVVDERVDEAGEAAIRGAVVDLFPADAGSPYRLELEGDRIGGIRRYDALTQRTAGDVEELTVGPASELLIPPELLTAGAEAPEWLRLVLDGPPESSRRRPGTEHLLPLAYPRLQTLPELLPDAALVLEPEDEERREAFVELVRDAFESRRTLARVGGGPTLLEPERLYLGEEEWERAVAGRTRVALGAPEEESALPRLVGTPDPRRAFVRLAAERLEAGDRVVVAAADGREAGRLARLVQRETGTAPEAARGWDEAVAAAPGALATVAAPLPAGFRLPGLAVVAAADVLGRRETAGAGPTDAAAFLPSGFHVGDRVVHADHGVAVLCGLEPVAEGGGEYLVLEYAGGHRALVPALEIDRLWRYGSAESEAPLDRLEGEAWTKRRAEVEAEIDEAARTLARVAAERARRKAPALVPDRRRYARFAGRFPYAPTDDQAAAIDATLADLARGAPPMDRLICGDVGYGKTEVALRAAAAAALAGKQVAVLAPTTVLVRQHLTTFRRRFAGLGVRVEQLSRLARTAEARATREGLGGRLGPDRRRHARIGLAGRAVQGSGPRRHRRGAALRHPAEGCACAGCARACTS